MVEVNEQVDRRSLLEGRQVALGAHFGGSNGWLMAQDYGDPLGEYSMVRSAAGLIDLTYCGAIKVSGTEAVQFLNGLVTNDVKTLGVGKGMRAAFLTGHGKVKALCRILNLGSAFLIITDPQTHNKVFKYVFPFSYAGDFKVEDSSEQYRLLTVQGPRSHLIMKEVSFEPLPELADHDWFETLIAGHKVLVARASHTGETGFDIFLAEGALADVWDFIMLKGKFHSLSPIGLQALESLRIEAAIPIYGVDVDETNMLLEIGLTDVVSFNKGCYTGQEAVAMATYRGHISKKLCGLAVNGDHLPSNGDQLKNDDKEIGYVTSSLKSSTLGSVIALAYVKYGFFEVGNELHIDTSHGSRSAVIVETPFLEHLRSASAK